MTRAQALATGLITIPPIGESAAGQCIGFDLKGDPTPNNAVDGYISNAHGLVAIFPPADVKTAQGIGVGSTLAQVEHAYPTTNFALPRMDDGPRVPVPDNPSAFYELPAGPSNTKVTLIALVLNDQDCFD